MVAEDWQHQEGKGHLSMLAEGAFSMAAVHVHPRHKAQHTWYHRDMTSVRCIDDNYNMYAYLVKQTGYTMLGQLGCIHTFKHGVQLAHNAGRDCDTTYYGVYPICYHQGSIA